MNQDWIKQLNDDMERRRQEQKQQDKIKIAKSYAGKVSQTTEAGKNAMKNFSNKGVEALKKIYGTDKWKAIQEKQWTEERRKKSSDVMKNISTESKSKNGHKLKEILTDEDRKRMSLNANITKKIKRTQYIKGIYDCILLNDWFTVEEAAEFCKQYNFSPNRNYRTLGQLLADTEFFEIKIDKSKGGKKKIYKKIQ